MEVAVSLKGVSRSYARGSEVVHALHSVNLEIGKGEFVALIGPSGSGKSTLLNLVAGIDRPTTGTVTIGGVDVGGLPESRRTQWRSRHVGIVFQAYHLLPNLSALENVEVPLLLTSIPRRERRMRAEAALELVKLSDRSSHRPRELSGGQQQRVCIARAMVTDPELLVCDEPTGDLDRENAQNILELLSTLRARMGKTILMVTHDPVAAASATRVYRVDKGLFQ